MAATKQKASADYVRLADEAELVLDGLMSRDAKFKAHFNRLLRDIPERAAIVQAFERFATNTAQLTEAKVRYERYVGLRDRDVQRAAPADSTD